MTFFPCNFTIRRGDRLYQPLSSYLLMMSALTYATWVLTKRTIPPGQGFTFNLCCRQFPLDVEFPIAGHLEAALSNQPLYEFSFRLKTALPEDDSPRTNSGDILLTALAPLFSNFYERQAEWLKSNVDSDPRKWPTLLNFARTVRNAVVHGGRVTINNVAAPPIVWEKISWSAADNGRNIYDSDFNVGDLVLLAILVDREMAILGAPSL